jgi:hypothetical protein
MKKKLGDVLVEAGLIDEVQLSVALGMQKQSGLKLGSQLLKLGFVRESDLSDILRRQLGIRLSLADRTIPPQALQSVPMDLAFKYKVMPVAFDGKTILLAMANPSDLETVDALTFQLGKRIKPVHALEWEIDGALLRFYQDFSLEELDRLTTASKSADQYKKMAWSVGNETVVERESPSRAKETVQPERQPRNEHDEVFPPDLIVRDADSWGPREEKTGPSVPRKPAPAPAAKEAPKKPAVQKLPPVHKKATLQQALIELLVEKGVITERELLEKFMKLERTHPEK